MKILPILSLFFLSHCALAEIIEPEAQPPQTEPARSAVLLTLQTTNISVDARGRTVIRGTSGAGIRVSTAGTNAIGVMAVRSTLAPRSDATKATDLVTRPQKRDADAVGSAICQSLGRTWDPNNGSYLNVTDHQGISQISGGKYAVLLDVGIGQAPSNTPSFWVRPAFVNHRLVSAESRQITEHESSFAIAINDDGARPAGSQELLLPVNKVVCLP